jgi:all-trans-retinol 13,14-reductase
MSHGGATGFKPPPGVRLNQIPPSTDIGEMLVKGELDGTLLYLNNRNLVDRSTIDICSLTDWRVFEPYAGTGWMKRGAEYEALKARLSDEMLAEIYRHYPQVKGRIAHAELATPLSFNHFLNRERGDFMSFAQTPERFAQRWMRAHAPVDGLIFSGQDVAAAGVSGAMVFAVWSADSRLDSTFWK